MQHFLLIDDDETFSSLLQRRFKSQGLILDYVANEVSLSAYSGQPQGIILDLNLGNNSGLQLLPALRHRFPHAKIIVLTGYASISTAVSAVKLGAWQYLPKPAGVETILQAFNNQSETNAHTETAPPDTMPSLQRLKWEHIQFVLQQHDGNISATARALNMHRRTLQRILAKYPAKR
ncbi:hypothetical protein PL75_08520 [Neisseria arctica]|uniref:Response regulatory domain-containing protein n=1 Tax=Neisseria arctica TaxID=1470200 RepID=A0A0J0YQN7_9NEIS|nr:response regulator [Neisseria arctica]KLT72429.1 hypothetical protein PL75_08520 [Neisseria arctica]UOO85997.1 response regulator [Neisseria arctica]